MARPIQALARLAALPAAQGVDATAADAGHDLPESAAAFLTFRLSQASAGSP
jgi:hypothetical protein